MERINDAEIIEPVLTFEPFAEEIKEEIVVEEKAELSAVEKYQSCFAVRGRSSKENSRFFRNSVG